MLGLGCSPIKNSQYQEYLSLRYEVPECNQTYTYASTTTITGTAKFFKRGVNLVTTQVNEGTPPVPVTKLKNMTQGDPLVTPLPIKFAEVGVYDANNKVIQCGKTDANGNLKALDSVSSLEIPAQAANYTVRVYSRINHELTFAGKPSFKVNASVKRDKYTNEVYYISAVANSNGIDDSTINLLAYARQTDSMEVTGGAFNILNNMFLGYDYIRSNTGTIDTTCLNNKLDVFWKIGFNPFQYEYPDQKPETLGSNSYYKDNLYITGGKLGNFSFERADHFSDYVVLHELGHHIENSCGSLLSPGGTHSIIVRIDPRLAWSEAWANYFAAQVMNSSINSINPEFIPKMTSAAITNTAWTYLFAAKGFSDSVQNIGSGSGFMFDIKKPGNAPDVWQSDEFSGQPFDKTDSALYPGEGHFREGAITRALFKLSNLCGTTCMGSSPISFSTLWSAMSFQQLPVTPSVSGLVGLGNSSVYKFKSSAIFMEIVKRIVTNNYVTPAAWTPYRTLIEQTNSDAIDLYTDGRFTSGGFNFWLPYGTNLTSQSASCSNGYKIQPRSDDPVLTGTNSDQRYSNHFYTIDLNNLAATDEISVSFSKDTGTDTEFDIILYNEDYFYKFDYYCPSFASDGSCKVNYQASRAADEYMAKSDRRSGAILTKVIRGLSTLDNSKKYLLNIRAYTANKSISNNTEYTYTIRDESGNNLCP
jgi:hypothetical protein